MPREPERVPGSEGCKACGNNGGHGEGICAESKSSEKERKMVHDSSSDVGFKTMLLSHIYTSPKGELQCYNSSWCDSRKGRNAIRPAVALHPNPQVFRDAGFFSCWRGEHDIDENRASTYTYHCWRGIAVSRRPGKPTERHTSFIIPPLGSARALARGGRCP